MTNDRIEYLLNKIISGILIFYYKDQEYKLKSPTPTIRYRSCLLYNKIINDEKYSSWIRESDTSRIMIQLGLWTADSDNMVTKLEKNIEDSKLKLYESLKRPDIFKLTKKAISGYRNQLNHLLNIKNNFRNNTLEGFAEAAKSEYIICNTLYCNNKKLFSIKDINSKNTHNYNLFNILVQEIYKQTISISEIRELSRSPQWKTYWCANKDHIFSGPVCSWTDDQRTLVNYSKMYDSVYEHPDCPEDRAIADDDVLDGWFIFQKKKREREQKQSKFNSAGKKNNKLDNAQEIFLMPNEDQTIEDILDLNDPIAKARFKQKINYINKVNGSVDEAKLPDVQIDLMNQRAEIKRMRK